MVTKAFVSALVSLWFASVVRAQPPAPLRLIQTIPLPEVEGRIDHMGVDVQGHRLFVAALGNGTVEVVDLGAGRRAHSIEGLREPQGVSYVPELNKLFVANGLDGFLKIFDADSLRLLDLVDFSADADNVRYDHTAKQIVVGYGNGALGIVDAVSGKRLGDIPLAGHPESFQLEANGPRIFVNVPKAGQVTVVDRVRRGVLARWPVPGARANYPMALDETHQRLFIACRKPAEVLVFDMASGSVVSRFPVVGDADDMFYDARRGRLYVSGGGGFLSVIDQRDADHYQAGARIPTASGARTALFVVDFGRLFLAVPHRKDQGAEIRVYEAE